MSRSPKPLTSHEVQRWTRVGTLAAFSLLLSYAETFVSIPIPGVKLGLANVAVLAELACGDATGATCIALIKVLASGLLFGSPLTMAYSAVGTALALAGMIPLSRLRTMRLWMVSVVGALLHEVGQLAVAQLVLRTAAVWYTLPVLMVAGCVTGALCGWLATGLCDALPAEEEFACSIDSARIESRAPDGRTVALCVALIVFCVVVLHVQSLPVLACCAGLALVWCLATGTRPPTILRSAIPIASIAGMTYVLQLVSGSANAGVEAGRAGLSLASLVWASRAFAMCINPHDLTGTMAWTLQPLTRRGVRTEGFLWAFDVALRLVPTLSTILSDERINPRGLRRQLPALVRDVCLRAAQL